MIRQQINKTSSYSYIRLNNEIKTFDTPVKEENRGGMSNGWAFVKNNRFFQITDITNVPWSNKVLDIEYASFRDKTLPGSEEKWKLKISGNKKEKVAAEILAAMYDASLDQFVEHYWSVPGIWPNNTRVSAWTEKTNFTVFNSSQRYIQESTVKYVEKMYDQLLNHNIATSYSEYKDGYLTTTRVMVNKGGMRDMAMAAPADKAEARIVAGYISFSDSVSVNFKTDKELLLLGETIKKISTSQSSNVAIRKNFSETAFFLPELRTDSTGAIEFSFTMPEALTKWKFMALAHTKDASFGYSTKEIVTQKELMVQPNAPRFLREGDKMEFSTKIVNLTDKELTGTAQLELFDASTNTSIDGWFRNSFPNQYFTVGAGQSESVKFPIDVPYLFNKALVWRIVARSGNYSDGEENSMPVLTNRMLVTESLPINMKGSGTKNFTFEKLLNSASSESLQHQSLTVEYSSNPAWYAVQALPYLMDYPYDCAEQTWNRYYANSLASYITSASPKIKQVFEQWKIKDTAALMSNLEKNQELKAVLLEETPWVLEAKTEAQQKKISPSSSIW